MKKEVCSYCGGHEFVIGKQNNYANLRPNKTFSLKEETVYHLVCLNCGTIVRSYVLNPRNLLVNNKDKFPNK